MRFLPGMEGWFNIQITIYVIHHINSLKKHKPHDHINRCRKNISNIQCTLMIKTLSKLGIQGDFFILKKNIYKKIILNDEKLESFSLRSVIKQGCFFLTIPFKNYARSLVINVLEGEQEFRVEKYHKYTGIKYVQIIL